DNPVYAVAVQPDSKVIIGGDFNAVSGAARRGIARLNSNGSLDSTFAPDLGPNPEVLSVAVQGGGKTVIGGAFTSVNGVTRVRTARLNADALSPAVTLSLTMYAGLTI